MLEPIESQFFQKFNILFLKVKKNEKKNINWINSVICLFIIILHIIDIREYKN